VTMIAGHRWWVYGVMDEALPDPPGRSLAGVHPVLADKWRKVHRRHPSHTNSGRRFTADQQEFWDCFQARLAGGSCPPSCNRSQCASANPPGKSNHEFGLAIDGEPQDGDWSTWTRLCEEEGLIFVVAGEPWHLQDVGVATSSFTGFPDDDWRPA